MKNIVREVFFGKNSLLSGVIALVIVGSIALGCNCNKSAEFGNTSTTSNSSSTSNSTPTTSTPDTSSSSDSVPSDSVVEGLVKETISEFGDAVESGDFSSLHSNASQDFQSTYTVDQMETAFKSYTDKKSVVKPIFDKVASMSADFSGPATIRTEKGLKILVTKGEFKTKPYKTRFDFEYVMRGGTWKLLKLIVNVP